MRTVRCAIKPLPTIRYPTRTPYGRSKTPTTGGKVVAPQRAALKAAGAPLDAVKAVGLSGQMHGATLLDANNAVLRPCILWNDGRSHAECVELETSLLGFRDPLRQHGHARLHRAQAAVGAQARAGIVRPHRQGLIAQRLFAIPTDRPVRLGPVGCCRYAVARSG
jgi:hypothetical protein